MIDKSVQYCLVCPHKCLLAEGRVGVCGVRTFEFGKIRDLTYGHLTALSLDPIEKKPLACYRPGSMIFSVGSYGCNLRCDFCQNYEIASADAHSSIPTRFIGPEQLVSQACLERKRGNIGVAYTYNEPFISWEYMRDCSRRAHAERLVNVAVTNGYVQPEIWEESLDLIDAFNIDLKCFSEEGYRRAGAPHGLKVVKESIRMAVVSRSHVELTTLIVPGLSDDEEMFKRECDWVASLDENIPLHITRFFPAYKMNKEQSTGKTLLRRFRSIAEQRLARVFLGNI